jgi:hypothetical protein
MFNQRELRKDITRTRGNVIVDDIKIGDIHYEFDYGMYIECKVVSLPVKKDKEDGDTYWTWESINTKSGKTINYAISKDYSHYGPKLYDYMAYEGCKQI